MEILEQFGVNQYLLAAQIINFAVLLFLLKKFLYGPILKVLDERKKKIAASLKSAEEIEKRLAASSAEQERILDTAKKEASQLVTESKQEAKSLTEKMIAETKETVETMVLKTEERLKLEKEQMLIDAKKDLAILVMEATKKVSGKVVDKHSGQKFVTEIISGIDKK